MLIVTKSAGVAPEMNLGNLFNAGEGSTLALKPRANVTKSPKTEISVAPQKGLMPPNFFGKDFSFSRFNYNHQPSWFEPMHCLHRSPTQMKAIVRLLKSSHVYAPLASVKCAQFNEDVSFKGRSRLSANKYLSRKTWKGKVNIRRVKSCMSNMRRESTFPFSRNTQSWQCWHIYLA